MINIIRSYLESSECYGALFSKRDPFCGIIENQEQDPTYILSKFTGSNATILITLTENILFTDMRYYQRAESETRFRVIYDNPYKWISKNLTQKQKIAVNPIRHLYNQLSVIEDRVTLDLKLNDLLIAPDDYIHENLSPISSNKFPEMDAFLSSSACTSAFLMPENYSWVTGLRDTFAEYNKSLKKYGIFRNGTLQGYGINDISNLDNDISKMHKEIVCLDKSTTPYFIVKLFEKHEAIIKDKSIYELQSIKTDAEIESIRIANKHEAENFVKIINWVRLSIDEGKSITEKDVSDKILEIKSEHSDFLGESFKTIVASGPNSSIIHYDPDANPRKIERNDILLIDSGSHYYSGTTDITRTISIGTPTQKQKQVYKAVYKGLMALSNKIFPKSTSGEVLEGIARQHLWDLSMDYPHSTGHGIGFVLNVHEAGCGIAKNIKCLMPGFVTSCEPGCYIPGEFGVRLEDTLVVREHNKDFLKFEPLTNLEFDSVLLG